MKEKIKKTIANIFAILIVFIIICFCVANTETTQKQLTKEDIIEKQFGLDGSHVKLTRIIKKSLDDPKSYQHVSTKYWEYDDYIIVVTNYRSRNIYGGTSPDYLKGKFTINGEVLKIFK